ncbi:MAG TPA: VanZ family protein [Usitatibacter sp.]|nr:VanZ family protein [Usitatibacter sp.]
MTARRFRGLLAVWVLLIGYASLYPFGPLRLPPAELVAAALARPRYVIPFDVVLNVLAYFPLGVLATLAVAAPGRRARAMAAAVAFGAALSTAMEACQLLIPGRVASIYDVFANAAGTATGALAFADPFYSVVTLPLGRWRERALVPGAWGDAGLMLLALWLIAQLNPALPFFGAGNIGAPGDEAPVGGIVEWGAVAFGICGFGLFVSVLLAGEQGSLRVTLVLLSVALWLKFVGATLFLQPYVSGEWVTMQRLLGIAAGLAALAPLRRLPRAGRAYVAILAILAGALLSKIFGAYTPLEELLRIFRWPYGQLANLATLTRFLHELWPFAALAFLIALFLRDRRAARAIIAQ